MNRLLAVIALAAAALTAATAHAQRYAVLSLIGDRMQLAFARGVEGQPVDRIERRYIPLDDSSIDRAALLAANEQIRKLKPGSDPVLLQAFERSYFDVSSGTGAIIEWVRQLVKDKKATHAILITKLAYGGIPHLQKAYVGHGDLEGVGFFVGRTPPPTGADANSAGPGFLSPFAYFTVSLVDLSTGRVLREERGLASDTISAANTDSGNPWEALSGTEKVRKLTDLVGKELAIVLPKMLSK
ncbi:MAG TPA: hypothetical protein VM051_14685 [Usitatibacter sp.]|nr:hypothetical protein [Usitatibacter sp.]